MIPSCVRSGIPSFTVFFINGTKFLVDIAMETVRLCSVLLQPVIPDSATRVLDQLGVPPQGRTGKAALQFGALGSGDAFTTGSLVLFAKARKQAAPTPVAAKK